MKWNKHTIAQFAKHRNRVASIDRLSTPADSQHERTAQIIREIWGRRGKRLRPHLVFWFGELSGVETAVLRPYARAAEALHTASLLHDDVLDEAQMRRGKPSINQMHGNRVSVLAGDYLLSDTVQSVSQLGNQKILEGLCKTLCELVHGEILQNDLKFQVPSSSQPLLEIQTLKTASLLVWCASVGPLLSQRFDLELARAFMTAFGRLFQASDDLLDFVDNSGKTLCSDLRGGLVNSALWLLIQADSSLEPALLIDFSEKKVTERTIALCQLSLKAHPQKVRFFLEQGKKDCLRLLDQFPEHPVRRALEGLVWLCANRV